VRDLDSPIFDQADGDLADLGSTYDLEDVLEG